MQGFSVNEEYTDESKCIQFCYKLSKTSKVVREADYITLYSQDMRKFSIEYCEASMEELYKLKEEGQLSSTLLDDKSALSNSSNPEISRLWINLMKLGFLSLEIQVDRKIIFTLDTSKSLSISVLPISDSTLFYLSPFCWIRPSNGNFIIQDASQICQLTIHDVNYMKVISELSKSTTIESLTYSLGQKFSLVIPFVIKLMLCANLIQHSSNNKDEIPETLSFENFWNFEDRLFHERSRWGTHNKFIGASFPLEAIYPAPPVRPKIHSIKNIPLIKPSKETIGPSFFDIVMKRKSYHEFGSQPISIKQLGQLLWYVLHIKSKRQILSTGKNKAAYEITKRPVPSGGGMHEIEIYLTVNRCSEIENGLYHYNAEEHCLEMIRLIDEPCHELLKDAARAAKLSKCPDILITLACRYDRLAWKYQGIVYSLILKHVGVIFQQLYLVSTALGLAPCALGVGNTRTFQDAASNDSIHQITHSVGEFIIGSIPENEKL